jgi:hypothetical protein
MFVVCWRLKALGFGGLREAAARRQIVVVAKLEGRFLPACG